MGILNQLGELFLAAVPTVIIVFLFFLFLRWSFFIPMERILSERHKRADGARQEAESMRAAAQEKLRAYQEALRNARNEIFTEQEAKLRLVLEERHNDIREAREEAQKELHGQKKSLHADVEAARAQLEESSNVLAGEIAEAVLAGARSGPVQGGLR